MPVGLHLRTEPAPEDCARVRRLVEATGFFSDDEAEMARELIERRLACGRVSGYHFLFAERDGELVGYACYGPVPATVASFDLYWIAVHPSMQGHHVGRLLLDETERRVRALGGARVYVETSNSTQYGSTRAFYERCGYTLVSLLDDFYAPGDAKATYCKRL